jgi:ATP-dependent RNA helicase DDX35
VSLQRRRLPIFKAKQQLLYLVDQHSVLIVIGENGTGKSTQIPQYLVEAGWTEQGYRIGVVTSKVKDVATRIADEMSTRIGSKVGYQLPFEKAVSGYTGIVCTTPSLLLQELLHDPLFSRYSVIILDDIQERVAEIDLLMGMIKK